MTHSSTQTFHSACRMCHGVHQVLVQLEGNRVVKVSSDPDSLLGGLCPKGIASTELLYHPDRLRYPLRRVGARGENRWERISWDEALDEMAERLSTIKQESGAEYFALTQGTGRPYTDFTARFANAFGTPNFTGIAHNCMTPRALASLFTTGSLMPPMPDLYFEQFCEKGMLMGEMRYEKYKEQGFHTPNGKVQLICRELEPLGVSVLPVYREPPLTPISAPDIAADYPLILTSVAKTVFFFHSEGRQIPSLRRRQPDPLVDIHPETAAAHGIAEDDWVWIETPQDRVRMKVRFSEDLAKDVVSAQHWWWYPEAPPPEYGWKESSVNLLFDATDCDPDIDSESLRSALCRIYQADPPKWATDEESRQVVS